MSWQKQSEVLDKRTGKHTVVFVEPESGAEHHEVILANGDLPEGFDVKIHLAGVQRQLQAEHDAMEAYARTHRVPVRTAEGKTRAAR